MSVAKNKDFVSLLAVVVSELLDDTDEEEEFMPLKAVLEAKRRLVSYEAPLAKKPDLGYSKPLVSIDKYSMPSRFENATILQVTHPVGKVIICQTSLKPVMQCLCKRHKHLGDLPTFSLVVNQIGGGNIPDMDFKANWHMSKETVEALYQILFFKNLETPAVTAMEFLAFLWSLAKSEDHEAVELRFQLPKGELHLLERKIYDIVLEQRSSHERWPRWMASTLVSEGFEKICGFPGAMGVVDCVHFPFIGTPYAGTYQNRNNEKTIVFELACDHRGVFTYSSYFWWPGKYSNMDVHRLSTISSLPIPDENYLLANRYYAGLQKYVVPFKGTRKKSKEEKFNHQHALALKVMKDAIKRLVSRFNTVTHFAERTGWVLRKRFACCIILHNLCTELEGPIDIDKTLKYSSYFPPGPKKPEIDAEEELRERLMNEMLPV